MIRGLLTGALALAGAMLLIQLLPMRPAAPQMALPPRKTEPVRVPEPPRIPAGARTGGEPAELLEMGRWLKVFIIDRHEGKSLVRFPGRAAEFDQWVPHDSLRVPVQDEDLSARHWKGQAYFRGMWRSCDILKRSGSRFYVHYAGESESFDEWIPSDRLRLPPQ